MRQGSPRQYVQCVGLFGSICPGFQQSLLLRSNSHADTKSEPRTEYITPSKMTVYDATVQAAFEPLNYAVLATKLSRKHGSHEKRMSERFVPLNTHVAVAPLGSYHTTPFRIAFKRASGPWFNHTIWDIESSVYDGPKKRLARTKERRCLQIPVTP